MLQWPSFKAASKFLVASISQLLISITGFAWTFFLLHSLDASKFGEFSLIQAISLLLAGLIGALAVLPHLVRMPAGDAGTMEFIIKKLLFYLTIPFLVVAPFMLGQNYTGVANVLVASLFLGLGFLPRDSFVRATVAGGIAARSLWPNAGMLIFAVSLISIFTILEIDLSLNEAVWFVGFTAVVAPALGYFWLLFSGANNLDNSEHHSDSVIDLRERVTCGMSFLVGWIQAQAILVFVYYVMNPESAALLAAARILVAPFVMLSPVINNFVMYHFRLAGLEKRVSVWRDGSIMVVLGASMYSIVIVVTFEWIGSIVFPAATIPTSLVVLGVICLSGLQLIRDVSKSVLFSMHKSSDVLRVSTVGALLMVLILVGAINIWVVDLETLIWLTVFSEFLFMLLLVGRARRVLAVVR